MLYFLEAHKLRTPFIRLFGAVYPLLVWYQNIRWNSHRSRVTYGGSLNAQVSSESNIVSLTTFDFPPKHSVRYLFWYVY